MIPALIATIAIFSFIWKKIKGEDPNSKKAVAVPKKWKAILEDKVNFYRNLDQSQKLQFESDVYRFLSDVKVNGVKVEVTVEDRLLVASSAVIPLFGFPTWTYKHLNEVLLYPGHFDRDFNIKSDKEVITGMVGNGPMEGKVILSKPSLHLGFDNTSDKKNVGIHEFVHLFDKEDGAIDGIPPGMQDKAFSLPWLDFVRKKTTEIIREDSDINPYGATNHQEFFAVASEYFFERPHLLENKHPELYATLSKVFNQDMSAIIDPSLKRVEVGRNSPCSCGSGLKYKRCCMEG